MSTPSDSSNPPISATAKFELTILALSLIAIGVITPPDMMPWWAKYAVTVAGAIGGAIRIAIGLGGK